MNLQFSELLALSVVPATSLDVKKCMFIDIRFVFKYYVSHFIYWTISVFRLSIEGLRSSEVNCTYNKFLLYSF